MRKDFKEYAPTYPVQTFMGKIKERNKLDHNIVQKIIPAGNLEEIECRYSKADRIKDSLDEFI